MKERKKTKKGPVLVLSNGPAVCIPRTVALYGVFERSMTCPTSLSLFPYTSPAENEEKEKIVHSFDLIRPNCF